MAYTPQAHGNYGAMQTNVLFPSGTGCSGQGCGMLEPDINGDAKADACTCCRYEYALTTVGVQHGGDFCQLSN